MSPASISSGAASATVTAASRLRALGYDPDELLQHYRDHGYIILDGLLASDTSSPLHLDSLRRLADTATQITRDGKWPHRRIVGNAFPPFTQNNRDSWGVQHIMNPQLDTAASASAASISSVFQQFYASSPLLDVASLLIGCQVEAMQMELFNLLVNPASHRFALGWHRDDIRPDVSEQEEEQRLETPTYGVQFNTALWDDDCLFIVPGTHRRLRTAAEVVANNAKAPPAVQVDSEGEVDKTFGEDGAWNGVDPPNTMRVRLKPGQTAFYSQRILHRASYLPTAKRATLHGCYGDASSGTGAAERARNVLQHGVEWMRDAQFGDSLPPVLKPSKSLAASSSRSGTILTQTGSTVWDNLLRMDAAYADKQLGFSLDNN